MHISEWSEAIETSVPLFSSIRVNLIAYGTVPYRGNMQVQVSKALKSQSRICETRENCSINQSIADQYNIREGTQIRVHNKETDRTGAYTVHEIRDEDDPPLRISQNGRQKLGSTDPFTAEIQGTTIPNTDLSYQEAWRTDDVAETTWHDPEQNPRIAFSAPHSGDGERNTDRSAVFAAKQFGKDSCSVWMNHNFGPDATPRWHIQSARISPVSYPGLQQLTGYGFEYAVSFHLWDDGDEILIGGLADRSLRDDLAEQVYDAVNGKRDVETEEGKYMAETEDNFVNWLTADNRSGVQIEAPAIICQRYRKRLGECVADFFADQVF